MTQKKINILIDKNKKLKKRPPSYHNHTITIESEGIDSNGTGSDSIQELVEKMKNIMLEKGIEGGVNNKNNIKVYVGNWRKVATGVDSIGLFIDFPTKKIRFFFPNGNKEVAIMMKDYFIRR